MLPMMLILGLVFLAVTLVVLAAGMAWQEKAAAQVEDRLATLAGKKDAAGYGGAASALKLFADDETEKGNKWIAAVVAQFNLDRLCEQADAGMNPLRLVTACLVLGFCGALAVLFLRLHAGMALPAGLFFGALPILWLLFKRKRRFEKFAAQLPEALELIARALRAGHSLGAGFRLVASETSDPIGREFGRVFEEQNLGLPLEDALQGMTTRIPNLDLKFFATAVVLQRQTGGDLAEILDKIGHLIRERFKIWGQVQALTGEGRLSGIVLLALPPALFVAVYRLNPDYVMPLFTEDMGKKMLIGGILMQLLGALVIRKIVNIRV